MAGDEVNFGTAWVEVHAKLDDYEREMDEAERTTRDTVIRIRQQAGEGGGGGGGFGLGDAIVGYSVGKNIGKIRRTVSLTQRLIGLVRTLRSVVARVFWPVLLITEGGRIIGFLRDIPSLAARAWEALKNMSISGLMFEIDQFIRKIPIIGHLWSGVGRTLSEISGLMGFSNFSAQIDGLEKAAARAENRLEGMARAAKLVQDSGLSDAADQHQRSQTLSGLEGGGLIRAQGAFDISDLQAQARAAASALYEAYITEIRQLRQEKDDGLLDEDQMKAQMEVLTTARMRLMRQQETDLEKAIGAAQGATAAKLARQAEDTALDTAMGIDRVRRRIMIEQAEMELEGADMRAEQIRLGYQFQILDAIRDGEQGRAALLDQLARVRIQQVRRHERETWDAWIEEQDAGSQRLGDRVREGLTDINRIQAELDLPRAGRSRVLEGMDINASADRQAQGIRRQIDALRQAQAEFRAGTGFVIDDGEAEKINAYAEQIKKLEALLDLNERLRQKRQELADQRDAERRAGGGDIDIRNIVAGSLVRPGADADGTGRESLKIQNASHDQLVAIRKAVESGQGGVFQ